MVQFSDDSVFVEGSTYPRHRLKARILKQKLIEYKCVYCGFSGMWNNKPLTLQLEHKNGISNDNRLSNLAFACPNCHTQTETYAGKNSTGMRVYRPEVVNAKRDKLEADQRKLNAVKPLIAIGAWGWKTKMAEALNISPQKLDKWLKRVDPSFTMPV